MSRATPLPAPRPAAARRRARGSRRARGGTLIGLFVGLALGLGLAAGVAYYLMRSGNPYRSPVTGSARDPGKDLARGSRAEPAPADKPRFDFYKILPGVEEPKVQAGGREPPAAERAPVERTAVPTQGIARLEEPPAAAPAPAAAAAATAAPAPATAVAPRAPRSKERLWLQAGSFSTERDAENLRAQLALAGLEAVLQQATLPDKSVRFRVRLGPYDNVDEAMRAKGDLARHGVDAAVIK